ncbi:NERD domain-containing protein [Bacillus salacetis]|uniref:NERD domain-containing protein n=2 Tax=Bacillus salacetis TaxID=2315464 RepID=A0A3A1QQK4_9BACI|nr:NERD domain-containing protein [Bacillus salacetis]
MNFTEEEESYYQYKEKGYQGEVAFDKWAEPLESLIFLNDVNLNVNNSHFQNDSLGITSGILHIFEVKNLEGDYTIKNDKWHSPKGNAVKNPLLQLEKAETLITQLVKSMGWRIHVKPHLVFVHPEFHLYNVPANLPIIHPGQLGRFREKLQQQSAKPTRTEIQIAEKLCSLLMDELPYSSVPAFTYEGLRKGIVCPGCGGFYGAFHKVFNCGYCGNRENCSDAVLRSIEEFKILFPESKMTTGGILEWCKVIKDDRTIRRILKGNFELTGHTKSAFYL